MSKSTKFCILFRLVPKHFRAHQKHTRFGDALSTLNRVAKKGYLSGQASAVQGADLEEYQKPIPHSGQLRLLVF